MEDKPKSTIEDLLVLIDQMLKAFSEHKGPIKMTPDIIADIDKLEAAVAIFQEDSNELLKLLDINPQELKTSILESVAIRSSDKQLIKRAEDIEREARVIKFALSKMRTKGLKNKRQSEQQDNAKKQIKQRRKLFKTIGGDQKWIPL